MEAFLTKLIELLKSSPRVYAALTLSGLAIIVPYHLQHALGLDELRSRYLPWVTLLTIVFGFLLVMSIYDKARTRYLEHIAAKRDSEAEQAASNRERARLASSIHGLTPNERLILATFVATGQQTLHLSTLDEDVSRLVQRGMLTTFHEFPNSWRAAHAIDREIFEFLNNNRTAIEREWRELERRVAADEPLH